MKIITAPERYDLSPNEVSVFLAGGITGCPNWQDLVIEQLRDISEDDEELVVFNPRRKEFKMDPMFTMQQIKWEFAMLEKAHIFSMYFCGGESVQPICMYELGRNIVRMQMKYPTSWEDRIIVTVEDGYARKTDAVLQTLYATDHKIYPGSALDVHANEIYNAFIECQERANFLQGV